ncbi:5'-methylthioadenosine/S-adenosylhomocysteine nucleosidase [Cellulomonas alba]|uniref:adenosylhomocysteine nucleosidase n=1 Tax=Cellulomonas alba TaxID=3053467 RepID=A0ABT7SI89_9CELL|nr:5'-methylthioadenosine/S-adenosylhomocysteine nucleosidase [Cellulomonas alba]MDM7855894.1 5'-methylthioadenosine/S-adenosylhomocysteine nucleosidase [Cellulomonas alba]
MTALGPDEPAREAPSLDGPAPAAATPDPASHAAADPAAEITAHGRRARRPASAPVEAVVVVAMASEAAPFVERASAASEPLPAPGGAEHRRLTIAGREVLLVRSGIGLVNAASAASVALAEHRPRVLVSAGSAGGLGVGVRVGDVVVGSQHAYGGADARGFGYALGQVPGMPPTFAAEARLHDVAVGAADRLAPRPTEPTTIRVLTGSVVSADVFVDADRVAGVRTDFPDALAADMETTALAHTAHLFGVPFLAVRGISDLCSPVEAGEFAAHVDDAADRSAAVVEEVLRAL